MILYYKIDHTLNDITDDEFSKVSSKHNVKENCGKI